MQSPVFIFLSVQQSITCWSGWCIIHQVKNPFCSVTPVVPHECRQFESSIFSWKKSDHVWLHKAFLHLPQTCLPKNAPVLTPSIQNMIIFGCLADILANVHRCQMTLLIIETSSTSVLSHHLYITLCFLFYMFTLCFTCLSLRSTTSIQKTLRVSIERESSWAWQLSTPSNRHGQLAITLGLCPWYSQACLWNVSVNLYEKWIYNSQYCYGTLFIMCCSRI